MKRKVTPEDTVTYRGEEMTVPEAYRRYRTGIASQNPKPTVVCPHCGKSGGINIMGRWHFENCKEKKDD